MGKLICLLSALSLISCSSIEEYKPYQYDNGDDYLSDGLYRIVNNQGLVGYANAQHEVVIKPQFAFGFPFEQGKAKVTHTGSLKEVPNSNGEYKYWHSEQWFYIDKEGKVVN